MEYRTRLLSESTRKQKQKDLFLICSCLEVSIKKKKKKIPSQLRTVTIEIAVEGLHSESVREIQFVLINVDLKVALDENGGVVVDVN